MTNIIRAMSLNLADKKGLQSVKTAVDFINPDIIGLQNSQGSAALEPPFSLAGAQAANAVFYRSDRLNLIESGRFWLSQTPSRPSKSWGDCAKSCEWFVFEIKESGAKFMHLNTCFDQNPTAKMKSVPLILNAGAKYNVPVLCTGDFGCTRNSAFYKLLTSGVFKDCRAALEGLSSKENINPQKVKDFILKPFGAKGEGFDYILINHLIEPLKFDEFNSNVYADLGIIER